MSNYRKINVLVLIKSLGLGGAERLLIDALPYLDRQSFNYRYTYCVPWKDFLVTHFEHAKLPISCLGMHNWAYLPLALNRLQTLYQQYQFDIIHAHLPMAGVLGRIVSKRNKVTLIYSEHNLQERYHPLTRWANKLTYHWNSHVLAVSDGVVDSIKQFGLYHKTTVTTLTNGVPIEQIKAEAQNCDALRDELGIPANHLIVGTVAIFREQKRLHDWLDVAAKVISKRDDVTFLLVGHGPKETSLHEKISSLCLEKHVKMPGFRPDGRHVLGLFDIYLMTSQHEGLPVALLEAMALGKPIVSTDVGGIPEVVKHGVEGLLTKVGEIEMLTTYVLSLLNDSDRRLQMGERGMKKIEADFHARDRVAFMESLYKNLVVQK